MRPWRPEDYMRLIRTVRVNVRSLTSRCSSRPYQRRGSSPPRDRAWILLSPHRLCITDQARVDGSPEE